MSENKFIKHLRGEETNGSLVEIKNQNTSTSFDNMPNGTSNPNVKYSDHRGNATIVAKGTDNWKLNNSAFDFATTIYGDGRDLTSTYTVSGNTTWVNAVYTFSADKIFTAGTKWVLKLCGHSLMSELSDTIGFSLIIKFNNQYIITKNFTVRENAFDFCQEFVVDFDESEQNIIKMSNADTMTVQLLCNDATASATIYNGMTVLTALQRRTDGDAVASDTRTFDNLEEDFDDLKDNFDQFVIDTNTALDGKVNIDGTSVMTAPLKFRAGSMRGAVGPYLNGVSFWKLDSQGNITNIANLTDSQFLPVTTNAIDLGRSANKWKDLYLAGKVYVATINNGGDLVVPAVSGTLATKADVDLAANSGRMITDQGVWYAKMYAATVAPAAENGTNYADFSQVDGQGNPIIVIYERQSGAWVQSETITPPAEYDGYVPITSKIWDIPEQAGQQGGRILWNHQSKEFTPYPQIISFENIEVTGISTVIMPQNPGANQIVNKDYVDTLVGNSIGDATITLTQGGQTMGSFTTNQGGDATIALDGGSSYHPDLFDFKWADHIVNDVQWLRADTFSWQSGAVYQAAYQHLFDDIYVQAYAWYDSDNERTCYTASETPEIGDDTYAESGNSLINRNDDIVSISGDSITTNSGYTWQRKAESDFAALSVSAQTETIAGTTITYYLADDGHKICLASEESNVTAIYNATGVAWYYIIDTTNQRFKLPRTRHAVTGLRDTVGKYVQPGLPNITGELGMGNNDFALSNGSNTTATGAFAKKTNSYSSRYLQSTTATGTNIGFDFDSSRSSSIYGNSTTVQPPATQMYLYFYVGEFTQTALENTAGITAETLNDKVDVGHEVIAFQAPTADNNYTWYRKYADGWIEQGGRTSTFTNTAASSSGTKTVVLPITMADTAYSATGTLSANDSSASGYANRMICLHSKTTTGFTFDEWNNAMSSSTSIYGTWEVRGMAA